MEKTVEIYTSPTCHFCKEIKDFFEFNKIKFTEYNVLSDSERRKELVERSNQLGVPVTFIDGEMIIGFEEGRLKEIFDIK